MTSSTDRRAGASSMAASLLSACLSAFLIVAGCEHVAPGPGGLDAGEGSGEEDAALDAGAQDASDLDAVAPDASAPDAGDADGGADASCDPLSCDAKCGPVYDPCLQKTIQCGACKEASKVCDIETHQCIVPKATCAALGAQCGSVKTSCGIHIACPDCPANQWCDPQTHQCTTCTPVTCQDLGYECGNAWNGCGPYAANLSCGNCANSKVCNTALHICEPDCSAPPDATVCAAAKANGVECGYITNGCGGLANCGGCPAGQKCGTRGVANRCEPEETSVECLVLGQNCGTLQSACGNTVSCGTCSGTDVCNANGVCGPRCVPKTCASADYQGKCGVGLDDGCGGKLRCDCASGKACSTLVSGEVGTCGDFKACSDFGATGKTGASCSNNASTSFPKGDNTYLTCRCTDANMECISGSDGAGTLVSGPTAGHCCQNTAACGTSCNTQVADTCTGQTRDCTCASGVCSKEGRLVSGSTVGSCCVNHVACGTDVCGTTLHDECTGAPIDCTCGDGKYCDNGTCRTNRTCNDYGANGTLGAPCSAPTGSAFDTGDGMHFFSCACTGSAECVSGGRAVDDHTKGTCCLNQNSCQVGKCNYTITDTCTNAPVACGCLAGQYCDTALGQCFPLETCTSTHPPSKSDPYTTRHVGAPCSNGPANGGPDLIFPQWPRGDGTYLTCTCIDAKNICVDTAGAIVSSYAVGTCCLPDTCATNTCNTSIHDHCTQKDVACTCKSPAVCSLNGQPPPAGTAGTCCTNTTKCGDNCNTTVKNSCTGADIACSPTCSDSSKHCDLTNMVCVANKTCSTYGANGAAGNPCSANPAFDRGDSQLIACGCTSPGVCSIGGALVTGANKGTCCVNTVACAADACATSVVNQCTGAAIACPSTCSDPNKHCDSAQKKCVDNSTCATYSANGKIGDKCSTVASTAFPKGDGSNLTCGCSQNGGPSGEATPNIQCTGSSASAAGTCTCVPTSCTVLGAGPHPNDGCGKAINCNG
jgi:hypothetical protein